MVNNDSDIDRFSFLFAFLIFFPTTIFGGIQYYIITFIFSLFFLKGKELDSNVFKLLLLVSFLSCINFVFNFNNIISEGSRSFIKSYPYILFLIPSYFIATEISRKTLYWVLMFILFEVFIGILEYYYGKVTFFTNRIALDQIDIDQNELLYFRRVLGLSGNSSGFADKIQIGFIVLYILKDFFTKNKFIFINILLTIGLLTSFNRTAIITVFIFLFILLLYKIFNRATSFTIKIVAIIGIGLTMTIISIYFINILLLQFTRNSLSLDVILTHRDEIWKYYFNFIEAHLFCGNGSVKLWYGNFHAHNTFIMTLASNGAIISILLFSLIVYGVTKKTFPYILTFILSGLTQYEFLWGISFPDIFFLFLIINKNHLFLSNEKNEKKVF